MLSSFAAADGRQEWRDDGPDEPVRPQACRQPQVQLRYPPQHFPQHQHEQLSPGCKLPRLPHPLRYVCSSLINQRGGGGDKIFIFHGSKLQIYIFFASRVQISKKRQCGKTRGDSAARQKSERRFISALCMYFYVSFYFVQKACKHKRLSLAQSRVIFGGGCNYSAASHVASPLPSFGRLSSVTHRLY